MKKIYLALILALMFVLSISVTAEEGYTPGINSYTNNSMTDGAKTVIIYRGTDGIDGAMEDIYYIDQCDDAEGFSNLKMLMKLDAPAGVYTVATNLGKATFEISKAEAFVSGATEAEFLGAEKQGDSYSVAFGFKADLSLINAFATLTMVMGEDAYTTDLCGENSIINWGAGYTYDQNGSLMLAIQIDNVGSEYMTDKEGTMIPNFDLYIK